MKLTAALNDEIIAKLLLRKKRDEKVKAFDHHLFIYFPSSLYFVFFPCLHFLS